MLYRGEEVFDIYRRICPAYLEDESEVHNTEPYVYSQTATGRASGDPDHTKNSWLTGTASWAFVSVSQAVLGIQPDYDGFRVSPYVPGVLNDFTVTRLFPGRHVCHPCKEYRLPIHDGRREYAPCIPRR